MTIATILRVKGGEVATVAPDTPLRAVVATLHERRIGAVLVLDGGRLAGVLSERDIVRELHRRGPDVLERSAGECMTADVVTCSPDDSLLGALARMTDRRIRHLPVVDGERLAGIVSIGDLVKARLERLETEADQMKAYISGA